MYLKQLVASERKVMSNFTKSTMPADVPVMFEFHDKVSNIYFFKILNVSTRSLFIPNFSVYGIVISHYHMAHGYFSWMGNIW